MLDKLEDRKGKRHLHTRKYDRSSEFRIHVYISIIATTLRNSVIIFCETISHDLDRANRVAFAGTSSRRNLWRIQENLSYIKWYSIFDHEYIFD